MSVLEVNNLTKDYGSGRGVFDVSFLSSVPGMVIYSPASYRELEAALEKAAVRLFQRPAFSSQSEKAAV